MKKYAVVLLSFLITNTLYAANDMKVFEVKGVARKWIMFNPDGLSKNRGGAGDEVVYQVDIPNKKVTRTMVNNAAIKEGLLAGWQKDNTIYDIVYDQPDMFTHNKRVIKAIGRTGMSDGFETIVIGEDFILTSSSKYDYFSLYNYRRIGLSEK